MSQYVYKSQICIQVYICHKYPCHKYVYKSCIHIVTYMNMTLIHRCDMACIHKCDIMHIYMCNMTCIHKCDMTHIHKYNMPCIHTNKMTYIHTCDITHIPTCAMTDIHTRDITYMFTCDMTHILMYVIRVVSYIVLSMSCDVYEYGVSHVYEYTCLTPHVWHDTTRMTYIVMSYVSDTTRMTWLDMTMRILHTCRVMSYAWHD